MSGNNRKRNRKNIFQSGTWEALAFVVLMFYPLRHIQIGLDLWDTGYNYANFQYMGLEHMDPMWLYSTYLANAMGHFLTTLPGAGTLVGMNLYTGLFVSVLAMAGYLFSTRMLKWNKGLVFVGELAAMSLCWCPTALLYNYLTYVLFLGTVILLYMGLTKEKKGFLFAAGVCLGSNVLVRFSNLPQAALIVAVWAYGILLWLEKRKATGEEKWNLWKWILQKTGWCLAGYLGALAVLFGYIHLRYGMDNYIEGILRLLSMTDNATDYKASSMLMGLIGTYVENLYWVVRIGCIVAAGMVLMTAVGWCVKRAGQLRIWEMAGSLLAVAAVGWLYQRMFRHFLESGDYARAMGTAEIVLILVILIGLILSFLHPQEKWLTLVKRLASTHAVWLAVTMVGWLYQGGFCAFMEYYHYGAILRPGVLFLMLTMGIGVIRIFQKSCSKEEKLISGLLILVILLTSLGSNNKVYPSLNNLFLAAPYALVECWRFLGWSGGKAKETLGLWIFPAKCILIAFLGIFLVQTAGFGGKFVFAEATGVQDTSALVENNEILAGVRMSADKAEWMTEISAYVEEHQLTGREVILYGQIPALSYYLQMPSAFNPWSDLASYHVETMEESLRSLTNRPVVITERSYAVSLQGGEDAKWALLADFLQDNGYESTFENEKFVIWE